MLHHQPKQTIVVICQTKMHTKPLKKECLIVVLTTAPPTKEGTNLDHWEMMQYSIIGRQKTQRVQQREAVKGSELRKERQIINLKLMITLSLSC